MGKSTMLVSSICKPLKGANDRKSPFQILRHILASAGFDCISKVPFFFVSFPFKSPAVLNLNLDGTSQRICLHDPLQQLRVLLAFK